MKLSKEKLGKILVEVGKWISFVGSLIIGSLSVAGTASAITLAML